MDDDDENLVDWGYDDDVEEVVDASGPIEDEDDILASDGEHDSPRTTQPQPPPTTSTTSSHPIKPSSSSSSRQPSKSHQSPPSTKSTIRPPPSPSTSYKTTGHPHPLPAKLGPSPRLSHSVPKPRDLPSRPSSFLQPTGHLSDRRLLSAEPISSNGSAPPPPPPPPASTPAPAPAAPEREARSPTPEIAALPPGWIVRTSSTRNMPYYYHAASKTALWDRPDLEPASSSSSKPAPARKEQQQQQQPAKKAEPSLVSRIGLDTPKVSSTTSSSSVVQRQEPSRLSGIPHSEHHQAYLDARPPSPPPKLLNRLGDFAPPSISSEAPRSTGASSTLRGRLSPPRLGRTTGAARSRSPPPLNPPPRSSRDIAVEGEKSDQREQERLREVEREKERERGRAMERERLLEKERNNARFLPPARRRSPPPFTSSSRARSPPPHVALRAPLSPPPRRRSPSPGPYRRPISRSPPPRPRQRSISPRRPRPIPPPSRWPKPTEERAGTGGGWGSNARAGRPESPPPASRPLSSQRPPLDSRVSNSRPPLVSRASGSTVEGARVGVDARREADQGPAARRPSPPPSVVARGTRERSPPPRRSPSRSNSLSEPKSQRALSPPQGPSSNSTALRAPDTDPKALVHPSRAGLVAAAPSAPSSSSAPRVSEPAQRPTVLVPPFASLPGIRIRQELETGRNTRNLLKGSDSNYSPIGSRPGAAPARRWGASAAAEEVASPASTSNTPIDAPPASSSSTPRNDPSPRAITSTSTSSSSSAPHPPPTGPRSRDLQPGQPRPMDSYNPAARDQDDQRGRAACDPRSSISKSREEREMERESRFRDASPRMARGELPPEEPWEKKRIAERIMAEERQRRMDNTRRVSEPSRSSNGNRQIDQAIPSSSASSSRTEAQPLAPRVHPSRASLVGESMPGGSSRSSVGSAQSNGVGGRGEVGGERSLERRLNDSPNHARNPNPFTLKRKTSPSSHDSDEPIAISPPLPPAQRLRRRSNSPPPPSTSSFNPVPKPLSLLDRVKILPLNTTTVTSQPNSRNNSPPPSSASSNARWPNNRRPSGFEARTDTRPEREKYDHYAPGLPDRSPRVVESSRGGRARSRERSPPPTSASTSASMEVDPAPAASTSATSKAPAEVLGGDGGWAAGGVSSADRGGRGRGGGTFGGRGAPWPPRGGGGRGGRRGRR